MSSGRHRRNPAPDEQPWPDRNGPGTRSRPLDETSPDLRKPRRPAPDETSPDLRAPRRPAPDETSVDLPAWRDPRRRDTSVDLPAVSADETSVDLPAVRANETSTGLPPWHEAAPPRRGPDETSVDLPAWSERAQRRPGADETAVDLPVWNEPPRRPRAPQPDRPPARSDQRRPRRGRGALRMAVAAVAVAAIGIGVSVYGLTTRTTQAGATYTPKGVGSSVPAAQPDPAAEALSRSLPVKLQIPAIGVSAPIEQVGLLTNGEVQTPPLEVHNLTGWYKYGPTPGENGASVILGHVDSYQGLSVFYYLKDLVKGDQIGVTLADGITANFVVDGLQKASKDDFPTQEVYGKIGYPGLRLITCGGAFDEATGHYDSNIIVYAHLVHSATT